MSAGMLIAATAVAALPAMTIGGLGSGGTGLVGGVAAVTTATTAPVVVQNTVRAATAVAAAARTPTGQQVIRLAQKESERAQQVIATLPNELFKPFQCVQCAEAMVVVLKDNGISGQVMKITANNKMDFMVNDLLGGGTSITQNGFHQAVRVGDVVFDNFLRDGASHSAYVGGLWAQFGVSIEATPF